MGRVRGSGSVARLVIQNTGINKDPDPDLDSGSGSGFWIRIRVPMSLFALKSKVKIRLFVIGLPVCQAFVCFFAI